MNASISDATFREMFDMSRSGDGKITLPTALPDDKKKIFILQGNDINILHV